jgi:ABC-2 type transport system permease protein
VRKILLIALRDYNAAVRSKAFLVSLVLLPVIMGGSFVLQEVLKDRVDTRPKRFALIDRTPGEKVAAALTAAAEERNRTQIYDAAGRQTRPEFLLERVEPGPDTPEAVAGQRLELSDRVRRGELTGFVEVGADVARLTAPGGGPEDERRLVRYQAHSDLTPDFTAWLGAEVNKAVEELRCGQVRLPGGQVGLPVEQVRAVAEPVTLRRKELATRDPDGTIRDGTTVNRAVAFLLPTGLVVLMFMMIFVGASPLMQGVVEEKMQRIAEVLLGSVPPFPLMLGKLLGTVGVALTLGAVYLGGAFWAAQHFKLTEHLAPPLLAWFLGYQVLGVLLYGSLFIAIGAACTNIQETQALLMPVMLVAMLPLFVLVNVIQEPNSPLAFWGSLFPPATPMLMPARMSVSPSLPAWQPALGGGLVLLTTLGCVYAAGRIFRVGLLLQGKGASFADLARWVVRG